MTRRALPLGERLRQGLASAVITAAALASPSAGVADPSATRSLASAGTKPPAPKTAAPKPAAPKTTAPKTTAPKTAGPKTTTPKPAHGCGAHDGGCGPSR
jgi:hypothetical protein